MRMRGQPGMGSEHTQSRTAARPEDETGHSRLTCTPVELDAERHALFAQLGELLYPVTKSDERFFLMAPELYLAIARIDEQVSIPSTSEF